MVKENLVVEALKGVMDPHTGMNVYEMGLISELKIEGGNVSLNFTPTSPYCPMGIQLAVSIKQAIKEIEGVKDVKVTVQGHLQSKAINEMLCNE
ncbi:MAG: metal-sulfur cluster assembly factor [Euryarchaeota archaeon]|nr:metal-sulfur cluster assembly factor [Euryarchaeota archaeon]